MSDEEPLRIWWNRNLHHKISPMKLAAHAAHAALHAYGIEYTHPIVVLAAGKSKIEAMPIAIHDEGRTELAPGTLTTGVEKFWGAPKADTLNPYWNTATVEQLRAALAFQGGMTRALLEEQERWVASRKITDDQVKKAAAAFTLAEKNDTGDPITTVNLSYIRAALEAVRDYNTN